ncbi:glutathione S-transferase 1-like isoform X2 [Galleria mellonella]|uniref:Glutathione S-transferase 1-like isoform X2 n=1 Tax=Galleria mellonella TaxID=7137 RepID=A0A6J3C0T7_GALME|nr:glutathione S-transferase 1-like isoform X2 [Galleria mellonella]
MAQFTKPSVFENKPILYGDEVSPPVRFVLMTASVLGIDLKFHHIDLFCSENKSDFFTKINPLQKVPALVAGDDVICDSHAIALYLCGKRKNQKLYPRDPSIKAQIDQMLFFNSAELFPIDSAIYSEYFTGKWPADEQKVKNWYRLLDHLDGRLKTRTWLAGEKLYLCDICCAATVSTLQLLIPLLNRHKNVEIWLNRVQALPCFEINKSGLKRLNVFVEKIKSIV